MTTVSTKHISTLFLKGFIVLIGIGTIALLLWEPQIEGVNAHATNVEIYFKDPFLLLVYVGSIPFFIALYQTFNILRYVEHNTVFSQATMKALRTIKSCAFAIISFVALEEVFIITNHGNDDVTGGIFMGVLITFGSIVVAATAAMFESVLHRTLSSLSL